MISEDVIQKVKEYNNIVDIISETVRLRKSGKYYTGLCPFHNEKTPSFTVTPDKQIYKCFGCGEAGNVITFIMKTKNLSYVDAIKMLADRANIEIEDSRSSITDNSSKLYKINTEAARYFYYNLRKNKSAMDYLIKRGLSSRTINRFGLGYALDSWDSLLKHLKGKGYTELDMLSAGLILKNKNDRYYDRFRNRIIFPVFDYRKKVIGFGGRVMDNSNPKYLNSPETSIFKKGTNLYGINYAIENNDEKMFIIVEGYMDCISLHQHGVKTAVASLGTAFTSNQAKLLKRYADKVVIAYDADSAGEKATLRGLQILKEEGFDVRVLSIPQGKDPDDFIKNNGKEEFLTLVERSMELEDYKIEKAAKGLNLKNPNDVAKYAEIALDIIRDLQPVEKDIYINKLSQETGIQNQALYDLMNNKLQKDGNNNDLMNSNEFFGNKYYLEPVYVKCERTLINIMVNNEEMKEYILETLKEEYFISQKRREIYKFVLRNLDRNEEEIGTLIESEFMNYSIIEEWIKIKEVNVIDEDCDYKLLIDDYVRELKKLKSDQNKKEIIENIKKLESEGKLKESLELAQQLFNIQKQLDGMQ
ncbi:DNA primase [uncultured Clostridium sp.]|uniref:DNA primase n=1 Tax=uncultured Clostridium sp. TaxID=59620 RepID=UPI0028E9A138|nr:DNA primase [uncultured Clostridium sp.]